MLLPQSKHPIFKHGFRQQRDDHYFQLSRRAFQNYLRDILNTAEQQRKKEATRKTVTYTPQIKGPSTVAVKGEESLSQPKICRRRCLYRVDRRVWSGRSIRSYESNGRIVTVPEQRGTPHY